MYVLFDVYVFVFDVCKFYLMCAYLCLMCVLIDVYVFFFDVCVLFDVCVFVFDV